MVSDALVGLEVGLSVGTLVGFRVGAVDGTGMVGALVGEGVRWQAMTKPPSLAPTATRPKCRRLGRSGISTAMVALPSCTVMAFSPMPMGTFRQCRATCHTGQGGRPSDEEGDVDSAHHDGRQSSKAYMTRLSPGLSSFYLSASPGTTEQGRRLVRHARCMHPWGSATAWALRTVPC